MKKLLALSVILFLLTATVNSQTTYVSFKNDIKGLSVEEKAIKNHKKELRKELKELKGSKVSEKAKLQFIKDFPNILVTQWERLDNFDEATFVRDGQIISAFYDDKAELVGTTTIKTFSDLPIRAQKVLTEKYKDYNVGDILFFDDNEQNETDMILYNHQFEDKDSYYIELIKGNKKIIEQVSMDGVVSYFTRLR